MEGQVRSVYINIGPHDDHKAVALAFKPSVGIDPIDPDIGGV
jgi:hypothetical protein